MTRLALPALLLLLTACPTTEESQPPANQDVSSVDPGFCTLEEPELADCPAEQTAGASCTVTVHNETGHALTGLSLARSCVHDGVDVDGYPTSPIDPLLSGDDTLPDGDSVQQEVVASPYDLRAEALEADQVPFHVWGGIEITCVDGEEIEVTVGPEHLYDGALGVINDTGAPIAGARVADAVDPYWGDELLADPIAPGESAVWNPDDGHGYLLLEHAGGQASWGSWVLSESRGTCLLASELFADEPCRWTLIDETGEGGLWRTAFMERFDCEETLWRPLPWTFDGHDMTGGSVDVFAPAGEWGLLVSGPLTSWYVPDLSCTGGEGGMVQVRAEHAVPPWFYDC